MIAAKRVVVCVRPSEKQKARRDCLGHLRASLVSSAATEKAIPCAAL
uniref:Uncharacterized protein n=1 Tax=Pakpunavirus sp. TaxID=2833053 RepID=A0AB39BZR4_9CAUD